MDLEAIPIQVQTPPKDDDPDSVPEFSSEPMDSSEVPNDRDIEQRENHEASDGDAEGDGPEEEIVVEPKDNELDNEDEYGAESPFSSASDSDAEPEVPKSHISVVISPPQKETAPGLRKLGDVEGIRARLDRRLGSDELLKNLHRVIYKRPGTSHEVKKNLRDFTGFHFADINARQIVHDKIAKFTNSQLKEILTIFGLHVAGSKDILVDNVVNFLNSPWDTKKTVTKNRRRSSGKVTKAVTKKKSSDELKVPQKVLLRSKDGINKQRKAKPKMEEPVEESPSEDEEDDGEDANDEDFEERPKKMAKITPRSKSKPKPKPKSTRKGRSVSPIESSDDDVPLRPGPSDAEIKLTIRDFLKSKDLSTVTKGMVKEALREKYGDALVKSKKEVIATGIEEGMEG